MAIRRLTTQTSRLTGGVRAFGAEAAEYPSYITGAPVAVEKTAANGLRIASITTQGETATVTAWIGAGSRYESAQATGVASLFAASAMASKGADIAAIGGQVSTSTSREHIVFEAKVLKENVAAATKLLGEMATGVADITASKECMLAYFEGMGPEAYEADLMDHLHDAAYLDSPMGTSVRGTPETLAALSADDVKAFASANVTAPRTVVAAAGAVDGAAFAAAAEAAFKGLPAPASGSTVDAAMVPAVFTGSDKRMRFDNLPMATVAIAFDGAAVDSPLIVPLMVMEAYLGSFDVSNAPIPPKNMKSMLGMDQGEQAAATKLEVINETYKDGGLFGLKMTAADNRLEDAMWYSLWNLVRCVHKISDDEVAFAKTQLKAKIVKETSTTAGLAAGLGKSISSYGRVVSTAEMFKRIDAVDTAAVRAAAKQVINDNDHALAATGPLHELPDYNWIRRRSYWLRY